MRFLVTGMGGFVGPHLARELLAHGHEVVGVDRTNAPLPADLDAVATDAIDLLDTDATHRLVDSIRPDALIHLAAQSNPARSWDIPAATFHANVGMLGNLLTTIRAAGRSIRLLHVSSSDVYGQSPVEELPLTESATHRPANPYAVSKSAAESLALLYARQHGVDVRILRPFSHTGAGQRPDFVVPAFARQIAEVRAGLRAELVHGNLESCRDFTDVRDVVRGYRLVAEYKGPENIFNVCSGRSVSIREVLDQLLQLAGAPVPCREDAARRRPEAPLPFRGDATRLKRATGWEPRHDLRDSLAWVLDDQSAQVAASMAGKPR